MRPMILESRQKTSLPLVPCPLSLPPSPLPLTPYLLPITPYPLPLARYPSRIPRPPSRQSAYTLIELIMVVLIIGLIATVIFVRADFMTAPLRLRSAAREIASTVRLAVNEGISRSRNCYIQYDLDNDTYWLLVPVPGPPEEEGAAQSQAIGMALIPGAGTGDAKENPTAPPQVHWVRILEAHLPDGVTFEDIAFSPTDIRNSGRVDIPVTAFGTTLGHIVHLANEDGEHISVRLNPLTGIVEFTERYQQPRAVPEDTGQQ